MGRKQIDFEPSRYASLILLLMGVASCTLVCAFFSVVLRLDVNSLISELDASALVGEDGSSGVLTLSSILPRSVT